MNEEIVIDEHFVRVGSKSYALDKINSVDVRVDKPKGMAPLIIAVAIAVLCLFAAIGGSGVGALAAAAFFAFLAWRAWEARKQRTYRLFLMTSSGEAQGIVTNDGDQVMTFRHAIEEAMRDQRAMPPLGGRQ